MKKSLGVLLAFGLAGLQFVAVLAVVFSSYVTSERALIEHARDLLRDVGINTIEHSKGFLSPRRARRSWRRGSRRTRSSRATIHSCLKSFCSSSSRSRRNSPASITATRPAISSW
ncbi:hypothetical protein QWZ10_13620 [Paracoccus cavernae]|uniref:Uncharacterized protein n=1 Tax=Paracoccus cavernae TaxID=1571207 RepID=A0ABT8D6X5_9RHOB|nr:hypothetical protein [Paracoccus cavernae]